MIRKLLQIMAVLLHKPIVYNLNILLCKLHEFSCSRNGDINPESAAFAIFQISLAHPVMYDDLEKSRSIFETQPTSIFVNCL